MSTAPLPKTLGDLKRSGWQSRSIKAELQQNLIAKIRSRENLFPGVIGYENSVIPELENAILSGHDIIFPRRARPGQNPHHAQPCEPSG